ncbi:hypothetical protein FRC03_010107 [Tulasnella sp. 419]|nr:hypothetical protein FRC03_010107 [Tulasnella sp. 419]
MAAETIGDIPPELKPLTPFLQRAQELKVKDPTMSYWCSYYAVQQGVHLKPRDKNSRNYLVKLMAPLEAVREDRGSNVVLDNDAACVYIEDFALRVFDAADNEDRRDAASRGTAKKFLAAANFLELLRVFEENGPLGASSSKDPATKSAYSQHREKIRYAKWKAADIAKAFREGRKPSPGPAHVPHTIGFTSPPLDLTSGATSPNGLPLEPSYQRAPSPKGTLSTPTTVNNSMPGSKAVSPVPGASRETSISPKNRDERLPSSGSGFSSGHARDGPGLGSDPSIRGGSGFSNSTLSGFSTASTLVPENASTPSSGLRPDSYGQPAPFIPPNSLNGTKAGSPHGSMLPMPPKDLYSSPQPNKATAPGQNENQTSSSLLKSKAQNSAPALTLGRPINSKYPESNEKGEDVWGPDGAGWAGHGLAKQAGWTPPASTPATNTITLRQNGRTGERGASAPTTPIDGYYGSRADVTAINTTLNGKVDHPQNGWHSEGDDALGPLPPQSDRPPSKRVRWTPSVVGGMSSVASSSPRNSPSSEPADLPTLPDSSDSASSSNGDGRNQSDPRLSQLANPNISVTSPNGWNGSPPTSVEEFPTSKVMPHGTPAVKGKAIGDATTIGSSPSGKGLPALNQSPHSSPHLTPSGEAPSPSRHSPLAAPRPTIPATPYAVPKALSPPMAHELPTSLSFRQMNAVKKHSKFAMSALDFDDIETARAELTRALAILNGERTE